MGNEYTIDLRIWAVVLAIAFCLGQTNLFGIIQTNDQSSITPSATTVTTPSEPSSLHFQLDFKGAPTEFLQSKDQLIKALTKATNQLDLTMLSATCQGGDDDLTCLAILEQGQLSIQTFPHNHAISVDLIQYGALNTGVLPLIVKTLKEQFGNDQPEEASFWSFDYRGQAMHKAVGKQVYSEVSNSMIAKVKELLYQNQDLEIWKILDIDITLSHEAAIEANLQPDDPRWTNNALVKPTTIAYLGGHSYATSDPENVVIEQVFVHPALMTQTDPNKIAVLGGPGNILLEIFKSNTVEQVTWFQPNKPLIQTLQEYLPRAYNCSLLAGRSENCLEDAALDWRQQEAKDYFVTPQDDKFDVIYGLLDQPHKAQELKSYVASVMEALSNDGAMVLSLGEGPTILHPKGSVGHFAPYEELLEILESLDSVHSIMVLEEDFTLPNYCTTIVPETFLLVCKSIQCRQRFYAKPEWIDDQLTERYSTRLEYYDGAVQARMQVPPKAYETIYCRRDPMPVECAYRTLDFETPLLEYDEDPNKSAFEVTDDGRVLATVDIAKGSYILAKDMSQSLLVPEWKLGDLSRGGGHLSLFGGETSRVLEMGIVGRITTEENTGNVGCWYCPSERPKYSPVFDRQFASFDSFLVAIEDIVKGQELRRISRN